MKIKFLHCRFRSLCILNIFCSKRCSNGSPFQTEVLEKLKAEGKKIGHLVFYFSQKEHLRLEVLDEISKYHQGCKFCDKIFAQLNENRWMLQAESWFIRIIFCDKQKVDGSRICDMLQGANQGPMLKKPWNF